MVIILRSDRWHLDQTRPELRRQARGRQRGGRRSAHAIARKPGLILLIGAQGISEHILQQHCRLAADGGGLRAIIARTNSVTWRVAGHQTAVVTPVEASPWPALPGLILEVGGLVKPFVVVDAEGKSRGGCHRRSRSAYLGLEKSRGHAGEHH